MTFRWDSISDIPLITDIFSSFYAIQYFGGQHVHNGSEEMLFRSIKGEINQKIYLSIIPQRKKIIINFPLIKKMFIKFLFLFRGF